MSIESMMYFALGAVASALIMLMILPAVWRRAVRLTRKRIEAATPITLAEFRADKDQLRAEFALSTRRLEMNVEALRQRLSEQLGDVSRKRSDLASLKSERDEHMVAVRELEEREQVLRERVLDLERESAELARRLSARDEQLATQAEELEAARETIRAALPPRFLKSGDGLSGDYNEDVDELLTALAVERKRAAFFETQIEELLGQIERLGTRASSADSTAAALRETLAGRDDIVAGANENLVEAEVRIANAESRLNALLEQTTRIVANGQQREEQLLAEKLSLEAQVEQLREKVLNVESTVMTDWESERLDQTQLRERLNDIASSVSRLIYQVDNDATPDAEESLFDRVQRFADDGMAVEELPVSEAGPAPTRPITKITPTPSSRRPAAGSVLDRMAALRELRGRN
jgi:chromosome segregation ATPase